MEREQIKRIVEWVGSYLQKYGQLPMMTEIANHFDMSFEDVATVSLKLDGYWTGREQVYPLGKIKI